MKVDKELVKNMAELSRIKITDEEVSRLEGEFSQMFDYFARIEEIKGTKTQNYVNENKGEFREDKDSARNKKVADRIVENFSEKEGRLMIAPKSL